MGTQDMELEQLTNEQLEAEIHRRRETGKIPPMPVENPDYTKLVETIVACVNDAVGRQYWDEDNDYYIYEAAVEAVFGGKFHEWLNKQEFMQ